jgi:hypothetical protein
MKLETLWPIDQKPPAAGAKTIRVTAECCEVCDLTFPSSSIVHWDIPARMNLPPIRISWYAGGREAEKRRRDYLRELFAKRPELPEQQRAARATWWDKDPRDLGAGREMAQGKVAQKPYVYQNE